jgi:hypothetical protein
MASFHTDNASVCSIVEQKSITPNLSLPTAPQTLKSGKSSHKTCLKPLAVVPFFCLPPDFYSQLPGKSKIIPVLAASTCKAESRPAMKLSTRPLAIS